MIDRVFKADGAASFIGGSSEFDMKWGSNMGAISAMSGLIELNQSKYFVDYYEVIEHMSIGANSLTFKVR